MPLPTAEYIGANMAPAGDASNVGMTWHRYTLSGQRYETGVVDASGEAVSDYGLNDPVTACVPLSPELRGKFADIVLAVTDDGGGMKVLPTSVKITPVGVSVCGKLSTLPASVAVGKDGPPQETEDSMDEVVVVDQSLPDTGGITPTPDSIVWLVAAGILATFVGTCMASIYTRRRSRRTRRGEVSHGGPAPAASIRG